LKMERSQGVYLELLFRKGVRDEFRKEALAGLAKLEKKNELGVLLDALKNQDGQQSKQDDSVVFDLVRLLSSRSAQELAGVRAELETMAASAKMPLTRQL